MSIEIIVLAVTGTLACLTYLVKHFKTSSCWSKDACCSCKMDSDDRSKSDVIIDETVIEKSDNHNEIKPPHIISSVV